MAKYTHYSRNKQASNRTITSASLATSIRAIAPRRIFMALVALFLSLMLVFSSPFWGSALNAALDTNNAPLSFQAAADEGDDGPIIGDNDRPNRTVKAGIFSMAGYHMMDDEGNYYGYGIDVLEMISKYSHLNFELVSFESSWGDMLDMLENGEIDVVTSASKTPEREALFDYSLPIGKKSTVLSISVNDNRFKTGDTATYNGIVVGEIPGNNQNVIFAEFANEKGFSYTTVEFPSDAELVEALKNGTVDAILTSDLRKTENEKTLETIEDNYYYAIVRKGETELLTEINYAIEQMDINEGDWKNTLFYTYYGPTYSSELSFTPREQAYIDAVRSGEKTIKATAFTDRSPYSFVEDGQLTGILVDYFSAVMDVAELPYEIVVPKDLADYESLIDNEEVDVVIDGVTGEYTDTHFFENGFKSDSFMSASVVQVTRTDFDGEIDSIAIADTSTGSLDKFFDQIEADKLVHYPNREAALQAVLDKKVDCAYVYVDSAQEFMNRDITNSLSYTSVYGLSVEFDIRVSAQTDHELISIINKCMKFVPESTISSLLSEYTTYKVNDITVFQYLQANPAIIVAICLLVVVVIVVVAALLLRGRWHEKLLASQAKSTRELKEQLSIVEALSRDYSNVFAVDDKDGLARIVKLEGYAVEGLDPASREEHDYMTLLTTYINTRVHPEDRETLLNELSLKNVRKRIAEEGEFAGTYRILINDDEVHHFQYTFVVVDDDEDGFLLAGFRNIDETIRKEQEQMDVLSEALAQAQYANQAKTTFLNNMSHDIRTPMNAIIGFTALAGTHLDNTAQVQSYLSKIMTSSNHLLSLINDVLDMSRIESGKVKIENNETNLPEVMHDLRTIVQSDIVAKGLEFFIDMLGVTDETVICDKLRLNQVLLNIVSNAIKYTRTGGIVSIRIIQSDTNHQDGTAQYQFVVKDTGIGMSKKFLEHVFEPFEREETSTVSGIQGTGLGLAITKNIVDLMGGTIEVTSEEDKGSEFIVTFRFPISEGAEPFTPPEELQNLRALVVDDDVDTCTSVSSMLHTIGMRPDWTTIGEEAIAHTEFALEQGDPYSAIIIDWIMPGMSGLTLVKRIRRIVGDETPIIVATAYDWTDIEEEAREAGVTAICSKPIFLSELRDVLLQPFLKDSTQDNGQLIVARDSTDSEVIQDAFDNALQSLTGTRILLVDDNEMNREIAKTILEDADIIVDTAEDGIYAVEKMQEQPAGSYDVILMDIQMPQMDGYEATRVIRELEDPAKASIPIIAVTANAFDEDRNEAVEAGMNGYISKPIDIEKLFTALENILDKN